MIIRAIVCLHIFADQIFLPAQGNRHDSDSATVSLCFCGSNFPSPSLFRRYNLLKSVRFIAKISAMYISLR